MERYTLNDIEASPYLVQNYGRLPVRFVSGYGCRLFDDRERSYLDCLSGIAVNALGHNHPLINASVQAQLGKVSHTSNLFHIGPQEELAQLLIERSFPGRVYFCNSGAEANECIFKVGRLWGNQVHGGKKTRIIACENSFHGRTLAAVAMTGTEAYRAPFAPLPEVEFVPFGDAAALEKVMGDDVALFIVEPVQGEGGVRVPEDGYLKRVRELCDQHEALLAFDEVQTGIGRCGTWFAHQHEEGVTPDLMGLAKGLGGGVAIGAVVMKEHCAQLLVPGTHASTFGGNHLASAAACTVIKEVSRPEFMQNVEERGAFFRHELARVFGDKAVEVRGRGLLIGVELHEPPAALMRKCLEFGLVTGAAGGNTFRLAPPLTITNLEIKEAIAKIEAALSELS